MDIHNIIKEHFDKNELFRGLPQKVRLAYHEINLYERKKIENKIKLIEFEEKQKNLSPLEKRDEIKRAFKKFGGDVKNMYGYLAYSQVLHKWEMEEMDAETLYLNFSEENTFLYLFNYVKKNLMMGGSKNYDLLDLFKKYILNDDYKTILKHIFDQGAKIYSEDFKKYPRHGDYLIKFNNEYYKINDDNFRNNFNNTTMIVKKLIPVKYNDLILYNYDYAEDEKITFCTLGEISKKIEDKKIHIRCFDKSYFLIQ